MAATSHITMLPQTPPVPGLDSLYLVDLRVCESTLETSHDYGCTVQDALMFCLEMLIKDFWKNMKLMGFQKCTPPCPRIAMDVGDKWQERPLLFGK